MIKPMKNKLNSTTVIIFLLSTATALGACNGDSNGQDADAPDLIDIPVEDGIDTLDQENPPEDVPDDPDVEVEVVPDTDEDPDGTEDAPDAADVQEEEAEAECGNGVPEGDEECDDGNDDNNDGCLDTCEEAGCGDGYVYTGEEDCDGDLPTDCDTACGSTGTKLCVACAWSECYLPTETCNGIDDDCNDVCDDGFECCRNAEDAACVNEGGIEGIGDCNDGCEIIECCAEKEFCSNGLDDDCDDETDEFDKVGTDSRVTSDGASSKSPAVAFSGSRFGIVWEDSRDTTSEIYFSALLTDGTETVTDTRLSDAGESRTPAIAWSGSAYGVAWSDTRPGDENTEIYFTRVSDAGVEAGADTMISNGALASEYPSLIHDGTQFALAWRDDRDDNQEIYFARVGNDGAKIGDDVRVTNNSWRSTRPSLCAAGDKYGVAWSDDRDGNYEIYFALLGADGAPEAGAVRVSVGPGDSSYPSIAFSGSEFGIAWDDYRSLARNEIFFARVSSEGAKIGDDARVAFGSGNAWYCSLLYSDGMYMAAWEDTRTSSTEVYLAFIDDEGTKMGVDVPVTASTVISARPRLVFTGTEHGLAFHSLRDSNYEIYFTRMACDPEVE